MNEDVKAVYASYPAAIRRRLKSIRRLILTTAKQLEVGEIEETLKWSEPAYLTRSKAGTTIRLTWKPSSPEQYRLLVHCQTSLIDTFRTLHPEFDYDGNRAIVFSLGSDPAEDALAHCIGMALTYHRAPAASKRANG